MLPTLVPETPTFRSHDAVRDAVRAACKAHPGVAVFHDLGLSEGRRGLYGVVLGRGPQRVSLVAGAHADEPVGPETLRTFVIEGLARRDALGDLLERFTFVVVPHVNPDGEARNRPWMEAWPDVRAYLRDVVREAPGRDVEFGYPTMRAENRHVAAFLREHAPFALHLNLHGMGFAEGGLLLVERHWAARTQPLRDGWRAALEAEGLPVHDHNRKGDKGFFYIERGFTTTPEGEAMRAYFRGRGDAATASRFHDSSMEYVRRLGGDPLCLVTELPLFLVRPEPGPAGEPTAYLAFKELQPALRARLDAGDAIDDAVDRFGLAPVPLAAAMRLQFRALELGLDALRG